jgi:hypothetical protein
LPIVIIFYYHSYGENNITSNYYSFSYSYFNNSPPAYHCKKGRGSTLVVTIYTLLVSVNKQSLLVSVNKQTGIKEGELKGERKGGRVKGREK